MSFTPGQVLTAALLNTALDACVKTGNVSTFMAAALLAADSQHALLALGVTDNTNTIPASLLPSTLSGRMSYQGTWNASTNVPTINTGSAASANNGYFYIVATAGTTTVDGTSSWAVGDWIMSNGTTWTKVANLVTAPVSSVAGRTGAVTLASTDLTDSTTVGRALLTAATVAAQRTALGLGSAALLNGGTSGANNLLQLDASGKIPAVDGSQITNIAASGRLLRAPQILTSGTSYTTPAGCSQIVVELVGGGANGQGSPGSGTGGTGGGAGAYAMKYFAVAPSTAYTYAIGAAAGSTTFTVGGVTVTAGGGTSGSSGGAGGTATNGDINITGQKGGGGISIATTTATAYAGAGGSGPFGTGGPAVLATTNTPGNAAAGYGGGGSGSCGTSSTGGSGTQGMIRIWEYA